MISTSQTEGPPGAARVCSAERKHCEGLLKGCHLFSGDTTPQARVCVCEQGPSFFHPEEILKGLSVLHCPHTRVVSATHFYPVVKQGHALWSILWKDKMADAPYMSTNLLDFENVSCVDINWRMKKIKQMPFMSCCEDFTFHRSFSSFTRQLCHLEKDREVESRRERERSSRGVRERLCMCFSTFPLAQRHRPRWGSTGSDTVLALLCRLRWAVSRYSNTKE